MLIGVHVSVAGSYLNGLSYGREVGAECIQFFAKSPRQWRGPKADPDAAAEFVATRASMEFGPVFTHTAYLLNMSTTNPELAEKTVIALADELSRAALLGVDGVVTHIGNDPEGDDEAAAYRAAGAIRAAYELAGPQAHDVRLLLENTAGGGSTFGCTFAQLSAVIEGCDRDASRMGICLDTCHGFAFGMPLDTPDGWQAVVAEIRDTVGLQRLGLIHGNDCMFEKGSRKDRHAWIGDGFIGDAGFSAMLCSPEIAHVPVVMEMPGDKPVKDEVNIARLTALRDQCAG